MTLGDTHTLMWHIVPNRRLGPQARYRIHEANLRNDAAFSAISIWEIGMLQQKGRIDGNMPAMEWRERLLAEGFNEIPVAGIIAARAGELPDLRGDPADRIIVATALDGHLLITQDQRILNWPGQLDRLPARR